MRVSTAITILMLLAIPAFAEPAAENTGAAGPSTADPGAAAAADRDAARWAELEAQARITDGDYDGAVQAEQQASTERLRAERYQLMARPTRR
ncbi:hypothetical protein [Rhodopila sp.]|uniref:hypothetical protein n=1 Tax=Rhodopila sp. TaxID=2480087 RepID=UPI003D0E6541